MTLLINRRAREKYQISESILPYQYRDGSSDLPALYNFVFHLNQHPEFTAHPEKSLKTGQINGFVLIDDIFHYVIKQYQKQNGIKIFSSLTEKLEKNLGKESYESLLISYVVNFPPSQGIQNTAQAREFLSGSTSDVSNSDIILENLILLGVAIRNPALRPFVELIFEPEITNSEVFSSFLKNTEQFFSEMPGFGPHNQSLIEMLKSPAAFVPHSIPGQLDYIRQHWAFLLGDYLLRLLRGLDILKEEEKPGFMGPGPVPVPKYDAKEILSGYGADNALAAFSKDKDWMPRLVLIAKNVFVWLNQLSRYYGREIRRLDQIPDEELETLSRRGINGLWLIGLWQRSPASARIKQLCGNPDAVASAYSLYTYRISDALGGEEAYEKLRNKAARYGIRLASDMVPNHMGIDSKWVIQHPEWFLSLDESPFPAYQFNGPDLSSDENVSIQIEDHYYDRSDAAVVFKRTDKRTGQVKYIYHGNDGTSMPWNDTAQLNYLDPVVREQVIQTILNVARKFPIIRFDAAMTLAKKHIERLWYPEPGAGGAIPSRSFHSITKEEFNKAMPKEFWREVVERIEAEVPDTLLLAEAFWLMEGYFVRTLGMHRVYNSAFMHMLRNEDNAGYRTLIKNTLDFDPEILKRYVNFMNNPDERTAVDQFGNGDKYFGICTLMTTLPGLPMFGHGQFEGFSEKYGMEYSRALMDENIDENLMRRHESEIFPLLYRRELFAGVENFRLFDFWQSDGSVNENVFAFSNQWVNQKTIVVYNNAFEETQGSLFDSYPQFKDKQNSKSKTSQSIVKVLGLQGKEDGFLRFFDLSTLQYFIRPVSELKQHGFTIHLNGYEHHVFVDFQIVHSDGTRDYEKLYQSVGHSGIPDIEQALERLRLLPILQPLTDIVNDEFLNTLFHNALQSQSNLELNRQIKEKIREFVRAGKEFANAAGYNSPLEEEICRLMQALLQLPGLDKAYTDAGMQKTGKYLSALTGKLLRDKSRWSTLVTWVLISRLGKLIPYASYPETSLAWLDEWCLNQPLGETLRKMNVPEQEIQESFSFLSLAIRHQNWFQEYGKKPVKTILKNWFTSLDIRACLKVNLFEKVLWYNRESFQEFLWWMQIVAILQHQSDQTSNRVSLAETITDLKQKMKKIETLDQESDYQVDLLLKNAE